MNDVLSAFVRELAAAIRPNKAYFVGGAVRDGLLGIAAKDVDIEVYGLSYEDLAARVEKILADEAFAPQVRHVDLVGKSFGVLKISLGEYDVDLSLPRRDSKTGIGHKDFAISFDPALEPKEAARRRDFTINAMMRDVETDELLDFYGGADDLKNKILKPVDENYFADDALRVLRGLQFAARFELSVPEATRALFKKMIPELAALPAERLRDEWRKLMLKAERPSVGLQLGLDLGIWDTWYPLFRRMAETPQEPDWHPEGDVWTHTLMVVDQAAKLIRGKGPAGIPCDQLSDDDKEIVMFAAFAHDFGKPDTTELLDDRVRSREHEQAGVEPAREFMASLRLDNAKTDAAAALVGNHLWPGLQYRSEQKGTQTTDGAFRRLAKRIAPATVKQLVITACADHLGRGPFKGIAYDEPLDDNFMPVEFPGGAWAYAKAVSLHVGEDVARPVIGAQELIDRFGFRQSPDFKFVMEWIESEHNEHGKTREEILAMMDSIIGEEKSDTMAIFLKGIK